MKHILYFIFIISMILTSAVPAFASGTDATADNTDLAVNARVIYPVDIITSDDRAEIRKVYEFKTGDTLYEIPREAFKHNGISYRFFDILKEDVSVTEHKEMTETVSFESKSNDMQTVMSLLPQTKAMTYDDGFAGTLALDISTIKTAVSGYGRSHKDVKTTCIYPNLSDADMQYIPKTTEYNGKTLNFDNVEWRTDNTMNVDDYEIPDRYTAVVTYSGTSSSSYIKGYTVTAEYKGEVAKSVSDKVRYTVIFTGAPAFSEKLFKLLIIFVVFALAVFAVYYALKKDLLKKRKEKTAHEENNSFDDGNNVAVNRVDDYPGISDRV